MPVLWMSAMLDMSVKAYCFLVLAGCCCYCCFIEMSSATVLDFNFLVEE